MLVREAVRDLVAEEPLLLESAARARFHGGDLIVEPSRDREVLYFLEEGEVQVYHRTPHGHQVDAAVLGPGAVFGDMPIVGHSMRFAYAEALTDVELAVIDRGTVERLLMTRPRVALALLDVLGNRLREAEVMLGEMAFGSVPARVAALLARRYQEEGSVIALSQEELARELGAPRGETREALAALEACGLIRAGRRRVYVVDPQGLQAIA
ncbi:MAG: Crp/Fnr family transcriptional regulator [Chloroflexi bacterium]|nr:Crp/Fnr family transcriptional regulator [Chloroflexota bacterium]